jgi:diphthamide synthase subunit DPH2
MVQTAGVLEVNVGATPELADATGVKSAVALATAAGCAKVMVFAFKGFGACASKIKMSEKSNILVQFGASVLRSALQVPLAFTVIRPPRATSQIVGVALVNHHQPTSWPIGTTGCAPPRMMAPGFEAESTTKYERPLETTGL